TSYAPHRDLHSFPTRRSSDLKNRGFRGGRAPRLPAIAGGGAEVRGRSGVGRRCRVRGHQRIRTVRKAGRRLRGGRGSTSGRRGNYGASGRRRALKNCVGGKF